MPISIWKMNEDGSSQTSRRELIQMKCGLNETPNTAFGARDFFPFLEFLCVDTHKSSDGIDLRIDSNSLYITPSLDVHIIVHKEQAQGQIDNSPLFRTCHMPDIVNNLKCFKEGVIVGNIITLHHLYSFLSQIMKQRWNLDEWNLPSVLRIILDWFK